MQQDICTAISRLKLGFNQRFGLISVMLGHQSAARIDVYAGNEMPCAIKSVLIKAGLVVADVRTSGNKNHRCSLAVSKQAVVTNTLRAAIEINNAETIARLTGQQIKFPLKMPKEHTPLFQRFQSITEHATTFYTEMVHGKLLLLDA